MRIFIFTAITVISASFGSAQAAPDVLPESPDPIAAPLAVQPLPLDTETSSFGALIARFMTAEGQIASASSANKAERAISECSEEEAEKVAKAEGAEQESEKKKQLVGPEPIYFAF